MALDWDNAELSEVLDRVATTAYNYRADIYEGEEVDQGKQESVCGLFQEVRHGLEGVGKFSRISLGYVELRGRYNTLVYDLQGEIDVGVGKIILFSGIHPHTR